MTTDNKRSAKDEENSHNKEKFWMRFGWISTGCIIYITTTFIMHTNHIIDLKTIEVLQLNEVGDLFAGIAGSLAMVWLIVTVRLQSIELKAQRKEMAMQREELNTANKHHVDQVKQMKLERGLAWQQLNQNKEEFLLQRIQHDEKHLERMLENICYQIWFEITNYFQFSDSFIEYYKIDNRTEAIDNALSNKNFNLAIKLITSFYSTFSTTQHSLKTRIEAQNNHFGLSYAHFWCMDALIKRRIFEVFVSHFAVFRLQNLRPE